MTGTFPFPALETDAAAIAAFTESEVSKTEAAFCDAAFDADVATISNILEDPDRLGSVVRRGAWIYSFERTPDNERGLWRRIPEGTPPTAQADWQTVFDLDAFCAAEGEDWHWRGAPTLWSNPDRVLIALSFQGSDQTRFLEWDCNAAAAVPGGFDLPAARSNADWLDADTLLVATAALPGSATRSGWQGRAMRLGRNMDLAAAPIVFEVDHDDLLAGAYSFPLRDGTRGTATYRVRAIGDVVKTLHIAGEETRLHAPAQTNCAHNDQFYAYVASDDGPDPAGTLVLHDLARDTKRILFSPAPRKAVDEGAIIFTRDYLFWVEADTLEPSLRRLDLRAPDNAPIIVPLPVDAQSIALFPFDAKDDGTAPMQLYTAGFLTPAAFWLMDIDSLDCTPLLENKPTFNATGMAVRLHMATSADGTEIPYHITLPAGHAAMMGQIPVLQYGYGGFNVALGPNYLRLDGPVWLAKGGAYVTAYIRGGGEFGPDWHLAAKGKNRHRAFEDFAAIAADLVKRGYSTPEKIGCHGGSNGGLLAGVMLTRYPDHFGAVWASVGVMDMIRFHLFPAGAGWIDEYGDPDDPQARKWLLDYSPIHNVQDTPPYPPALIDTNESDDRVDPSHSRRFAAVLQAAGQPGYYHSRSGGHGGGGQSKGIAREKALGYAFLRRSLSL